jgi:hypothetical protein
MRFHASILENHRWREEYMNNEKQAAPGYFVATDGAAYENFMTARGLTRQRSWQPLILGVLEA